MQLSPKQSYVLDLLEDDTTTEILAGGAKGGGKSRILCFWILKNALKYPGTRWLIGRKELKRLKETTLITFYEVAREQGIVENVHFTIDHQYNVIKFVNGSAVLLMDLKFQPSDADYQTLGSLELTGAAIDEAAEVPEKVNSILSVCVGRHRNDEYGITGKVLLTCNPHKGWLYQVFYKPWRAGSLYPYQKFIPMNESDNPWLPEKNRAALRRLKGVDRERLLLGNWEYDADPSDLIDYENILNLWTNTFVEPGDRFMTCDIAMQGSDVYTVFVWSGLRVINIKAYPKIDAKEIEAHIKATAEIFEVPRSNIVFDSDGLGEYLNSYLTNAVPFHNGARPLERLRGADDYKENFSNLKTQTSFELAKYIQANKIYIDDETFKEQICEELRWIKRDRLDKDGKLFILPKEKVKAGLGRSPDFADALHMRMYFVIERERVRKVSGAASNDGTPGYNSGYEAERSYTGTEGY